DRIHLKLPQPSFVGHRTEQMVDVPHAPILHGLGHLSERRPRVTDVGSHSFRSASQRELFGTDNFWSDGRGHEIVRVFEILIELLLNCRPNLRTRMSSTCLVPKV